jgi:hypothetical protein
MKYFVSQSVLNSGTPGFAIIQEGNWIIVGHEDLNHIDSDRETNFHEVSASFFAEKSPAFAQALGKEENAQLYVDAVTGQVNVNTNHRHAGFIQDWTARASHQANLKASWWTIIKGRPGYLPRTVFLVVVTFVLCIFISWFFLFYLARILLSHVVVMQSVHNGLLSGDLNPGIVISESPLRIAVMTDLSLGSGNYPILRIIDTPVPKRYRKQGSKVPCAGGYQQIDEEVDKPYWDFYEPTPLVSYTDTATASMKRFEIPQYQWDSLYEACKTLPKEPSIGFYTLQDRENGWPEEEDLKFYDHKARMYGDKGEQLGSLD